MINLKNQYKKIKDIAILALCDFLAMTACMVFSILIVHMKIDFTLSLLYWFLINLAFGFIFFALFRMYFIVFTSVGIIDGLRTFCAAICIFCVNIICCMFLGHPVGYRVCVSYCIMLFFFALIIRFSKRIYIALKYSISRKNKNKIRAMIVGGGSAGTMLIREIQTTDKINYLPICVVDDDLSKVDKNVSGVKIMGTTDDIPRLAEKYSIDEILIAMPAAPKTEVKRIFEICEKTRKKVKTLPGIYQIVSGDASVSALRPVQIQDLLGRDQIKINIDEIMGYIENRVVLVTGGGGSIGSELCRQIAGHKPARLIIVDIYENNAYEIQQELKHKYPNLDLVVLIASVRNTNRINSIMKNYHPDIIYHAAAHKHVPLMEVSPNEAIKNNVFGTWKTAQAAVQNGVKKFVMISTDKAVNPTNIMGASKRICEMIIQTYNRHYDTEFVAVRFGNVLGSNGSVIPLFRTQIAAGGPVTVTHPDIIRYFMTIPEAVSLVLQAGVYARGGEIFVLDMGEPVKILDLAENLIRLSGYKVDEDIKIEFTGLRPGEKLYEELLMSEEGLTDTENKLIHVGKPIEFDETLFYVQLNQLKHAVESECDNVRELIQEIVPTYSPQNADTSQGTEQ